MKYHINQNTGQPNICKAKKRDCPVGGEHFTSKEEARKHVETLLAKEKGALHPVTKKPLSKTYLDGKERRRKESEIAGNLAKSFKKKKEKELNGVAYNKFAQEREAKRENGVIFFKNGFQISVKKYASEDVKTMRNYTQALEAYLSSSNHTNLNRVESALNELPQKHRAREIRFLGLMKSSSNLTSYFLSTAHISHDLNNSYPIGTTAFLDDFPSEFAEKYKVKDLLLLKTLSAINSSFEHRIETAKNFSTIKEFDEQTAMLADDFNKKLDKLEKKASNNDSDKIVFKKFRNDIETKINNFKALQLTELRKRARVSVFASRIKKKQHADLLSEIDKRLNALS